MLGDGLGALDTEPLADLTNGGLIRVRAQVLHHEIENLPLDFDERLDPASGRRYLALCYRVGSSQQSTPGGGSQVAPDTCRELS